MRTKIKLTSEEVEAARQSVDALCARGLSRPEAFRIVAQAIAARVRRPVASGVGEETASGDILSRVRSAADVGPIREVREAVSPWLWVLSVISFGMALVNHRRIAVMFKKGMEKIRGKRRATA